MASGAAFLAATIPLLPLLACLLTLAGLRRGRFPRSPGLVLTAGVLTSAAGLILTVLLSNSAWCPQHSMHWDVYRWLYVDGAIPLSVSMSVRVDGLSSLFAFVTSFVATLVAVCMVRDALELRHETLSLAGVWLLLFTTVMLFFAGNLLQLVLFWQLLTAVAALLAGLAGDSAPAAHGAREMFLVNAVSDLALAIGLCLVASTFGTFDFKVVLDPAVIAVKRPIMVNGICLCLFAGALGKCGLLPLFVWLRRAAQSPPAVSALVYSVALVPAGIYLMARCTPLMAAAPGAQLLMACVGGFTSVLTAFMACGQQDLRHAIVLSMTCVMGWVFWGLGIGSPSAVACAVSLFVLHSLVTPAMFLVAGTVARSAGTTDLQQLGGQRGDLRWPYWSFVAVAVLLPAGFCIQSTLLVTGWQAAGASGIDARADSAMLQRPLENGADHGGSLGEPPHDLDGRLLGMACHPVQSAVFWMVIASLSLLSFAVSRALFLTFHGTPNSQPFRHANGVGEAVRAAKTPVLILLGAAVAVPVLAAPLQLVNGLVARSLFPSAGQAVADGDLLTWLYGAGIGLSVALLGVFVAWTTYSRCLVWPRLVTRGLAPFTRLSRHALYFDEFYRFVFVLPILGAATLCRFVDSTAFRSTGTPWMGRAPTILAKLARPLQRERPQLYALALLLAGAALMLILLSSQR